MTRTAFLAAFVSLLLLAGAARADLIAGPDIIAAPGSAVDDFPGAENDHQQAFNERLNTLLPVNVAVDGGGFILAGTRVDSHMIFLNTRGTTFATDQQTWTFDGAILGVMSDGTGSLEVASTPYLGAIGTIYPGAPFGARGLESNDGYVVSGYSITVRMSVTEPGDWIRVVTAPTPEPGTAVLLALGAAAALVWRRRRTA